MMEDEEFNLKPMLYLTVYPRLRKVAIDNGYTLALHGSVTRDLDLVAIAWTKEAATAQELIGEFMKNLKDGYINDEDITYEGHKPFGRITFPIHLGRGAYIDISVIRPNTVDFDLAIKSNAAIKFLEKISKENAFEGLPDELKNEVTDFLKRNSYKI
jgi:hypothetical protein